MTELTTAAPWFSIISSQEAFILSKPYISLTSLTIVRFWITLVTDTQRRCEYNRLQRVVFSSTGYLLGGSYPEITNYIEDSSSWKANSRSASQEIRHFTETKLSLRVHKSPLMAPILSHTSAAISSSRPASFLTLYAHLILGFPRELLLQCFPTKIMMTYILSFMNPHGTHTSDLITVPLAQLLSQALYGVWSLYIRGEFSPVQRPAVHPALLQSRTVYLQFLNINAFYSNTVFCSRKQRRYITVSYKQ